MTLALAVGLAAFALGVIVGARPPRVVVVALSCAAALPWLAFVAYYARVVDFAAYAEWRALRSSDALAGLVGFPVGAFVARAIGKSAASIGGGALAVLLLLVIAFAKPLLTRMPASWIKDGRRVDGVCLQSTPATCGPCAASTVLAALGHDASERALASEADATRSGTLNWLLVRAIRARGFEAHMSDPASIDDVTPPAILGVTLPSGVGHFLAYLGHDGARYVIGEPLKGRLSLTREELEGDYEFARFAIEVASPNAPAAH